MTLENRCDLDVIAMGVEEPSESVLSMIRINALIYESENMTKWVNMERFRRSDSHRH